ncbi:EF-hand calcium-binding domain-containing protein 7-like [Oratosquilla oratoria]|uniref:EF-hand calcium-binding domain-containing protein 7-like n=1 Tax=Oratosquilla oratoria TaxID=337810 RepID=UPI003F76582E
MDNQESKQKELHAAFVSVKPTVADDISSIEELELTLQYAGFNPTQKFLHSKWEERQTDGISFEEFCCMVEEMNPLVMEDIYNLFIKVFGTSDGTIGENDFKRVLLTDQGTGLTEDNLCYILQEAGVIEGGKVNFGKLGRVIIQTVNELKQLNLQQLEERSNLQRINSKTYTCKKEIFIKSEAPVVTEGEENKEAALDVEGWNKCSLKGCFYLDKQNIIAHQYYFELPELGPVVIRMQSQSRLIGPRGKKTVDTLAYIFRESSEGVRNYVGYTDKEDADGYYWNDVLKEGKYVVIPYTSGCLLKQRENIPEGAIDLIVKDSEVHLTTEFQFVLREIFDQIDLDDNGKLNRQEFNLYNWRTSCEEVQDDEWAVVQDNFEVDEGELTLKGFMSLHRMEAEDNGGDSEDLWLSLETMGYNRMLQQDQAAPFSLSIYSPVCQPVLIVSGLKNGGLLLDKAVVRSVMENSKPVKIKNMIDLIKYEYCGPHRGTIVIQNKAHSKVTIRVDCSKSTNCITNRPSLDWTGEVAGKSAVIAHQLLQENDKAYWSLVCSAEGEET